MRRAALLGLVLLTGCAAAPVPEGPLAGEALVEALRDGGYVLYLRHTETTRGGVDDLATLGDCSRQRPLSEAGRQDARALGDAVEALDVPVGTVRVSPFCRTTETGRLAFGDVVPDEGLLALAPDSSNRAELEPRVRRLLSTEPDDGNTVLVGHTSNLTLVSDAEPEEGGTVVFRPDGDGRFRLVGEVPPQGWQALRRELD